MKFIFMYDQFIFEVWLNKDHVPTTELTEDNIAKFISLGIVKTINNFELQLVIAAMLDKLDGCILGVVRKNPRGMRNLKHSSPLSKKSMGFKYQTAIG